MSTYYSDDELELLEQLADEFEMLRDHCRYNGIADWRAKIERSFPGRDAQMVLAELRGMLEAREHERQRLETLKEAS